MDQNQNVSSTRRGLLQQAALVGGGVLLAGSVTNTLAQVAAPDWKKQVGLELYTVRDLLGKDYEGTVAKVAAMGYKEIEPASGYGGMDPKAFRAMLDRYGLSIPSTHSGARGTGAELEAQLDGFRTMGMKYTEISGGGGRGPGGGGRGPTPAVAGGPGVVPAAGRGPGGGGRGPAQPMTAEAAKKSAQQLNENGAIAKKFGMKILVHNHTSEFSRLADSDLTHYDVLLRETDPELVAMQLDIGWAAVAGQDILAMFRAHPGRFELWHVKDARGISRMTADLNQGQRMQAAKLVPVGQGEVNYKDIFAAAQSAGMKHFCIEQDNAADWGDSLAAAKVSFDGLTRILS